MRASTHERARRLIRAGNTTRRCQRGGGSSGGPAREAKLLSRAFGIRTGAKSGATGCALEAGAMQPETKPHAHAQSDVAAIPPEQSYEYDPPLSDTALIVQGGPDFAASEPGAAIPKPTTAQSAISRKRRTLLLLLMALTAFIIPVPATPWQSGAATEPPYLPRV